MLYFLQIGLFSKYDILVTLQYYILNMFAFSKSFFNGLPLRSHGTHGCAGRDAQEARSRFRGLTSIEPRTSLGKFAKIRAGYPPRDPLNP